MSLRPHSRDRLASLGIDVWLRRDRAPTGRAASSPGQSGGGQVRAGPRIRLASGDGDWLLVQDAPWDGRHEKLLGDIQATIGSARCRFGQWAHSESAGVSLDELPARGVRHVLVFGDLPASDTSDIVHVAPDLERLAASGQARRQLWRILSARLGD